MKRRVWIFILSLCFIGNSTAFAALTITSATPAAGTALTVGPNVISITASSPLEDPGNTIVVNDPNGLEVDDGSLAVNGNKVIVGMKPLTVTGVYTVTYNLVAADSTLLNGNYTFMFNSPGTISAPSSAPSTKSSTKPNSAANATSNAFVYFMMFLAALVAIFLAWYAKYIFGGKPKSKKTTAKKAPAKKAAK